MHANNDTTERERERERERDRLAREYSVGREIAARGNDEQA